MSDRVNNIVNNNAKLPSKTSEQISAQNAARDEYYAAHRALHGRPGSRDGEGEVAPAQLTAEGKQQLKAVMKENLANMSPRERRATHGNTSTGFWRSVFGRQDK